MRVLPPPSSRAVWLSVALFTLFDDPHARAWGLFHLRLNESPRRLDSRQGEAAGLPRLLSVMEGSRLTLLFDLEHPKPSDRTIDRPNPGLSRGGLSVRRPSHTARFLHVLTHGRGEK